MPADPKGFGIILFVALTTISAYFAMSRNVGAAGFALCVFSSAVASTLVMNGDRLQEIVVRALGQEYRVALKELQSDVDRLKRLSEAVARFAAAGIARENRFVSDDTVGTLLSRRDELRSFLRDAGIEDHTNDSIVEPITVITDWDLRVAIFNHAGLQDDVKWGPARENERREAIATLRRILEQPDRQAGLAEAEAHLRTLGDRINWELVQPYLDRYRTLLDTGRLPKIGRKDDLTLAPLE